MKVGKRLPEAGPTTPERAEAIRVRRDGVVADLVRKAESSEAAWETFSADAPTAVADKARAARAEALIQAVHALGVQVKSGREHVEALAGAPVPAEWVERFEELHTKRLTLRWKADAAVFRYPDASAERSRVETIADEEISKALGPAWPGEEVQEAMRAVNGAKGVEEVKRLCLACLVAAVRQGYGRKA